MDAGRALGKSIAENGIRLVYGGGTKGIMGAVASGVLGNGGEVTDGERFKGALGGLPTGPLTGRVAFIQLH